MNIDLLEVKVNMTFFYYRPKNETVLSSFKVRIRSKYFRFTLVLLHIGGTFSRVFREKFRRDGRQLQLSGFTMRGSKAYYKKLKAFLFSNKRKQHLADLSERADALNFPGIDQNDSEKEVFNLETDGSRENLSTSKLRHWHRLEP